MWEHRYNYERFSLALDDGRTPAEKFRDWQAIAAERVAWTRCWPSERARPFTHAEGLAERAVLA